MQANAETAAAAAKKESQGLLVQLEECEVKGGQNQTTIQQLKQQLQECRTEAGQKRETIQELRRQLRKHKGLQRRKIELGKRLAKVDQRSFQLERQFQVGWGGAECSAMVLLYLHGLHDTAGLMSSAYKLQCSDEACYAD